MSHQSLTCSTYSKKIATINITISPKLSVIKETPPRSNLMVYFSHEFLPNFAE